MSTFEAIAHWSLSAVGCEVKEKMSFLNKMFENSVMTSKWNSSQIIFGMVIPTVISTSDSVVSGPYLRGGGLRVQTPPP